MSETTSNPKSSGRPAHRKSTFSCERCRKRKIKCSGGQPACAQCLARGQACQYELAPAASYARALERRLQELEAFVTALHRATSDQERQDLLVNSVPPSIPSAVKVESGSSTGASPGHSEAPRERSLSEPPGELADRFEGLKMEADGRISFHGSTSFFQFPSALTQDESSHTASAELPPTGPEGEARRDRLTRNAWQQRVFERYANVPEPFQYLLDSHWCWVQPMFNFVYRPTFTRDMESLGPYYSHTLLNAILSQSVRWCRHDAQIHHLLQPYDNGEFFFRQVMEALPDELRSGHGKIPTVQTLLLTSARECSHGNRTQAWLYSGMAFRLIEDMGIFVDALKHAGSAQFSEEDIEIRNRLFWSCYLWDKIISLYLGRSPSVQHSQVSPPQILLDDSAENDIWIPHGVSTLRENEYPPQKAHSISCFIQMCRLAEILNVILLRLYDPLRQSTEAEVLQCVNTQGEALRLWWKDLPDFLKLEVMNLPNYSPPSHIVTLNCLYRAIKILLRRRILSSWHESSSECTLQDPNHMKVCVSSATSIITIFDLHRRSFGDGHCVLSLAYTVYMAASIFLLELEARGLGAGTLSLDRLRYCVQALQRVMVSSPVIKYPLRLITQKLENLGVDLQTSQPATLPVQHSPPADSQAPAEPVPVSFTTTNIFPSSGAIDWSPTEQPQLKDDLSEFQGFQYDTSSFDFTPDMLRAFTTNLETMSPGI